MRKVGIFTVGGSIDPIVNSIRKNNFDFIFFICTTGPNKDSSSSRLVDGEVGEPTIVSRTGLTSDRYEKFEIKIDEADDVSAVYRELETGLWKRIKERFPDLSSCSFVANYTGGTKSMSAALVLFALFYGFEVEVNAGVRSNLNKIENGDFPCFLSLDSILYSRDRLYFESLMKGFYYKDVYNRVQDDLRRVRDTKVRSDLMRIKEIMEAFILWDSFDHEAAYKKFDKLWHGFEDSVKQHLRDYYLFLKKLVGLDKGATGYEKVADLVLNAERRAVQERYDDAVARYYRATEMLAQIRLKNEYGIDTSKIVCDELKDRLPEEAIRFLMEKCVVDRGEDGTIKIGLIKSYELLSKVKDPLGIRYISNKSQILDAINVRNNSILAHGTCVIDKDKFERVRTVLKSFISASIEEITSGKLRLEKLLGKIQFPQSLMFLF